jgi:hypothetical protein
MTKLVPLGLLLCGLLAFIKSEYPTNDSNKTTNLTPVVANFAVVELFTSQGCSSCPTADDILRGLAERENVMVLSFHVTYWNRLGWKDSFSKPEFDERQSNYATHFNLNSIYTPQVIINGAAEMVGSHGSQIDKELSKIGSEKSDITIELSKNIKDKTLIINYKINKATENKLLNFALVERNLETKVLRGENGGRTLKHDNVVRLFKTVKIRSTVLASSGVATEGVENFNLQNDFKLKDCSVIVYLQDAQTMKIVAASKMAL